MSVGEVPADPRNPVSLVLLSSSSAVMQEVAQAREADLEGSSLIPAFTVVHFLINGTESAAVLLTGILIVTSILCWSRNQESKQIIITKIYLASKIWTRSSSLLAKRANVMDQHIMYLCTDFLTLTVLLFWLLMWVTSNPFLYLVIWLVFALAIITAIAVSCKIHVCL